jgi:HEAT repeat protein
MGQMFSYLIGIVVAGLIVFGLYMGLLVSSPAYARQINADRAAGKTLDELREMLFEGDRNDKVAAVTAICQGDDEIDRRVKLIAAATTSEDQTIQSICRLSVQRMGDRVKPGVRKLLASNNPMEVRSAAGVIRSMGRNGDEFAEPMLKLLKEGDQFDQHAALHSIQKMSPEKLVGSIESIIGKLDDKEFNTQCSACFVLTNMGPAAEPAVERLVQLLEEGNVSTRSRAAQALAAIGPVEGYDIIALVAGRLEAFSYAEKVRVLDALGSLGPDASAHLDKVTPLMDDRKKNCMAEATLAYYRISGDVDRSRKRLVELLVKRDTRIAALEALGGMGEDATEAIPSILKYLGDDDLAISETAILSLKQIGPTAESALPRLKKMLDHDDFLICVAAQEAIESISGGSEK